MDEARRLRALRLEVYGVWNDEDLSLDHIISVAKGGPTTAGNLQVLCKPCNVKKDCN